ncbi:hypothetical protein BFP97_00485 [Roseivirga sp. 4D4]|uniref:hypothetical protein n=1 Tax=Roseivirga sp. 4D4 TaxID=1889784 RepID=UPI0008536999|nr:hypothetical protein [Roseivirga sp. 4D4]OEK00082.1 hypothetical protein BFP97_00485 [Roseivirga sp. 4D4]
MRKTFFLIACLTVILWGCGDAGVQSDVSKNIGIDPISVRLSVPAAAVGVLVGQTPPINVNTGQINISSDEFDEYLDDTERFTINQITYTIDNFPAGSSADLTIDMTIQLQGQNPQQLLTTRIDDVQNNPVDVLLFDKDAPGSVNAAAISSLEQALKDGTSFQVAMTIVGEDVTLQTQDVDFDFIFKFDVTARIQLVD